MSYTKPILAILFVLTLFCSQSCADVHASIKNSLGNGETMTVRCKSGDNDLGEQTVVDGSEYGWDFSPNVWGTTLFYCDMAWQGVSGFSFVAYDFGRDVVRCESACSWLVSKEGMYGMDDRTGLWGFMYDWSS